MIPILASIGSFGTAYTQSDFIGKLIILGLIALSAVCWIVLAHKIWMTRHVRSISSAFLSAFEKNKDSLLQLELDLLPKPKNQQIPHPFGLIFYELKTKTIEILNKNHFFLAQKYSKDTPQAYLSSTDLEILETHVLTTISAQKKYLEKNLFVLSTIVTLAPFLDCSAPSGEYWSPSQSSMQEELPAPIWLFSEGSRQRLSRPFLD